MDPIIIGGIIGAAGTALVGLIKAAYSRNQNKKDQMDHEENLLQIGATMNNVNQEISDLRKTLNDCFTGLSKDMDRLDRKLEDFHSEQKVYNVAMIRHDIVQVYEFYRSAASIPTDVYESTMNLYDKYKEIGGNGFVDGLIEEMKKWGKG